MLMLNPLTPTVVIGAYVRRTYSNYGDRCFAAAGPKLWNSLSAELRQDDISFQRFKRLLKNIFVRVLRSRHIVINC